MRQGATILAESQGNLRECSKCNKAKLANIEIKPRGRVCFSCQHKTRLERDKRWRENWNEERRERHNEKNRVWRARHPDSSYAATKRWRHRNVEKAREIGKQYRERVIKDPIRHQASLENKRINAKLLLERKGGTPRVISLEKYRQGNGRIKYYERLPVEPLVEYIKYMKLTYQEVAFLAGCDEALIRRIMNGTETSKNINTIDKICIGIGIPIVLLYDTDIAVGRGTGLDVAI